MKSNKIIIPILAMILLCSSCTFKFDDNETPKPTDDKVYKLLTGNDIEKGKTWRLSSDSGMNGIGSKDSLVYNVYTYPNMRLYIAWKYGVLQNTYTFIAQNNQYVPKNQFVSVNYAYANEYFDAAQPQYADTALFDPNHKQAPFILRDEHNGIGTGYTLEITNGSYIGRFDKRNKYQILSIATDTLRLRHLYSDDPMLDPSEDPVAMYNTYVVVK